MKLRLDNLMNKFPLNNFKFSSNNNQKVIYINNDNEKLNKNNYQ